MAVRHGLDGPLYPRTSERHWMLREGQHNDLTLLASHWERQAKLLADIQGRDSPAVKAYWLCINDLRDWLRRNGFPEPPPKRTSE